MAINDLKYQTDYLFNILAKDKINELVAAANTAITGGTGWANYGDTTYTDIAPFSIVADTDTILPNDGLSKIESQLPADVTTFYDGTSIISNNGDGLLTTIELNIVPTTGGTTYVEFWFVIGGGIPPLYRRILSFPKGTGVIRPVALTTGVSTLGTWEATGAKVYVRSNGPCDIHAIRYVIHRLHKAT